MVSSGGRSRSGRATAARPSPRGIRGPGAIATAPSRSRGVSARSSASTGARWSRRNSSAVSGRLPRGGGVAGAGWSGRPLRGWAPGATGLGLGAAGTARAGVPCSRAGGRGTACTGGAVDATGSRRTAPEAGSRRGSSSPGRPAGWTTGLLVGRRGEGSALRTVPTSPDPVGSGVVVVGDEDGALSAPTGSGVTGSAVTGSSPGPAGGVVAAWGTADTDSGGVARSPSNGIRLRVTKGWCASSRRAASLANTSIIVSPRCRGPRRRSERGGSG